MILLMSVIKLFIRVNVISVMMINYERRIFVRTEIRQAKTVQRS